MLFFLALVSIAFAGPCCRARAPCAPHTTPAPCLQMDPTTTTTTTTAAPILCDVPTTPAPCRPNPPPCQMNTPTTTRSPCALAADVPATTEMPKTEMNKLNETCENGWIRFKESCYYIQTRETKSLELSEKHCMEMDSTLFVLDSKEELSTIIEKAPENTWTWLGLFKNTESDEPRFHSNSSISYTELPWLIQPGNSFTSNGYNSVSKCAAHWNPSGALGKYAFWYPCNMNFYYVCEKNSTLTAAPEKYYV